MLNPNRKPCTFHKDAEKVYQDRIVKDDQLRKIFDGIRWLITNDFKNGQHLEDNYYVIKSSENIPQWHKDTMDLNSMPTITILYSVYDTEIILEGINLTEPASN